MNRFFAIASVLLALPVAAAANPKVMAKAFADHCFSPFLTAQSAHENLSGTGARVDFYDLDPFSSAAPSAASRRPVTQGTNRRCEISFDGDHTDTAVTETLAGLRREGISTVAELPAQYQRTNGTALLAARMLNPRRLAVVHIGKREGPAGIETFMLVERLPKATEGKKNP